MKRKYLLLVILLLSFVMAGGIFEKGYSYTFTCLANSNNKIQTAKDIIKIENIFYKP